MKYSMKKSSSGFFLAEDEKVQIAWDGRSVISLQLQNPRSTRKVLLKSHKTWNALLSKTSNERRWHWNTERKEAKNENKATMRWAVLFGIFFKEILGFGFARLTLLCFIRLHHTLSCIFCYIYSKALREGIKHRVHTMKWKMFVDCYYLTWDEEEDFFRDKIQAESGMT